MWLRGLCNRNVAIILVTTAIILLSGCQLVKTKANDKAVDDALPTLTSTAVTDFSNCVRQYGEVYVTNGTDNEVFLKDAGKAISQDEYFTLKGQLGMLSFNDGWCYFEKIITDDQNCYLAVGIMSADGYFGNSKNNAPIIIKYDSNLDILGYYLLDIYSVELDGISGSVYAGFTEIIQDKNGDYIVVGYLDDMARMKNLNGVIAKFDRELNPLEVSVTNQGFAYVSVIEATNGGYYVAGGDARDGYPSNADAFNTAGEFGLVVKYNKNLELETSNIQLDNGCSSLEAIGMDKNGDIIVVGCAREGVLQSAEPFDSGVNKRCVGYIAKLNQELNVISSATHFEPDSNMPHSECLFKGLICDEDGSVIVNGSESFWIPLAEDSSDNRFMVSPILIRYSSDLQILNKRLFDDKLDWSMTNAYPYYSATTLFRDMIGTESGLICIGSTVAPNSFFMQDTEENFHIFIVSLDKDFNYLGRANYAYGGYFDSVTEGAKGDFVVVGGLDESEKMSDKGNAVMVNSIVEFSQNE